MFVIRKMLFIHRLSALKSLSLFYKLLLRAPFGKCIVKQPNLKGLNVSSINFINFSNKYKHLGNSFEPVAQFTNLWIWKQCF